MLNKQQQPSSQAPTPTNPDQGILIKQQSTKNPEQVPKIVNAQGACDKQLGSQDYEHIADRLLRQLQQQYEEVHRYDINTIMQRQANTNLQQMHEQTHKQEKQQENEQAQGPEGYQNLDDADQQYDNNLNSQSDSEDRQKSDQQPQHHQELKNTNTQNIHQFNQIDLQKTENMQLVQVPPTPQSTYTIPQPNLQTNKIKSIDLDKIKCFALSLDIQAPDWAKDPLTMQNRINQLFGKHNNANMSTNGYHRYNIDDQVKNRP